MKPGSIIVTPVIEQDEGAMRLTYRHRRSRCGGRYVLVLLGDIPDARKVDNDQLRRIVERLMPAAGIQYADSDRMVRECAESFLKFMASLPAGWLGKVCADVGALNEAYLAARAAGLPIPEKKG